CHPPHPEFPAPESLPPPPSPDASTPARHSLTTLPPADSPAPPASPPDPPSPPSPAAAAPRATASPPDPPPGRYASPCPREQSRPDDPPLLSRAPDVHSPPAADSVPATTRPLSPGEPSCPSPLPPPPPVPTRIRKSAPYLCPSAPPHSADTAPPDAPDDTDAVGCKRKPGYRSPESSTESPRKIPPRPNTQRWPLR